MKILFISHNAHPAGAQLLLLQFLQWLKDNKTDIDIHILLGKSGALLSDFQKTGNTYIYPQNSSTRNPLLKIYIAYKQYQLIKLLRNQHFDLVYSNTILNTTLIEKLACINAPTITHAHEMSYWLDQLTTQQIDQLKTHTDYFLTASQSVANQLIERGIASNENTYPVFVFVDDKKLLNTDFSKSLKKHLKLPEDAILIGACGAENFRKGKDWFIPIASAVLSRSNQNNIHFVWIGGKTDEQIDFDLNRCGYSSQIHFIDHLADAGSYFHELSLFLMISREDPFPIVNIEVAMQGITILAFENTGGTQELLVNHTDLLVPYGNISSMADRIISIVSHPDVLQKNVHQLSEFVKRRYTINLVAEEIYEKMMSIATQYNKQKGKVQK